MGPLAASTAAAMAALTAGLCKSAGVSLGGCAEFLLRGLNKKALEFEDITIGLEVALDFMV